MQIKKRINICNRKILESIQNEDFVKAKLLCVYTLKVFLKNKEGAIKENPYKEIISESIKKYKLYCYIGKIRFEQKKYDEAITYFKKALKSAPKNTSRPEKYNISNTLGDISLLKKYHSLAIKFFKTALENAPNKKKCELYHKIGKIKWDKKCYNEAIKLFGKALEAKNHPNPIKSELLRNLGECYSEKKMFSKAESFLEKSLDLNPLIHWSWFSLGKLYYKKEKYYEAISAFKKNLKIAGQDADSYFHTFLFLAMCYNKVEEFGKAYQAYKHAYSLENVKVPLISEEKKFIRKFRGLKCTI